MRKYPENSFLRWLCCMQADWLARSLVVLIYKLKSVQNTGTCYPGQGWFVRNLSWGWKAEALVYLTNPSKAWVACPGILHKFDYSIHFAFFYSSVGLIGNFAGLLSCTVPSAIAHCNQNEAGHQTIKAPSMPYWDAAGPWKHSLAFMPQDWWNRQMKWMKSVSMGSYEYKN